MVSYCSVRGGTAYATEKGVSFHPCPRKKTTGEVEMILKQDKKVWASTMVCSNHSSDAFTTNHVVFCPMICFSSKLSVSSSVRILLARLGANNNPIIHLSFSPTPKFLFPRHLLRCKVKRMNSLLYVVQNGRMLLCLFNKSRIPHSSKSCLSNSPVAVAVF